VNAQGARPPRGRAPTEPSPMQPDEFSLSEAAEFLGVPSRTLERWVRQGLLHGSSSSTLRFGREQLERWARRQGITLAQRKDERSQPPEDMLADALGRGAFQLAPALDTAADAIALAVRSLSLDTATKEALLREVQERERLATTALGQGIALPHPRRPPAHLIGKPLMSVVRSVQPLDWAAPDREPVDVVLMVAAPSVAEHLEMLSRISFALQIPHCLETLRAATSKEQVLESLRGIRMAT